MNESRKISQNHDPKNKALENQRDRQTENEKTLKKRKFPQDQQQHLSETSDSISLLLALSAKPNKQSTETNTEKV
ncbi:hypothetical protein EUTSA_v10021872mg [Eutrema salsugineum]|uniref:Uncharacterized protein n=1 Tax=Eutrema salsugineum TaxID=72664 RepID=V4LZA0_EUTSA|nr:hypothetical protein EUTSA_v10021872mg [Eutrema salsugineum]